MTKWAVKKKRKGSNLLLYRTVEGQPEVFLGEATSIGQALVEVSEFFEAGDLVETPEGPCIVNSPNGELNN